MADPRNQSINKANVAQARAGTGFTNLQRVLQANVGSRLGQQVKSGISGLAQETKQKTGQELQQFRQQAEANRLDTPDVIQKRDQAVQNLGQGQAPTAETKTLFQQIREAQYKGPQQLQSAPKLQAQAQEISGASRGAADPGKRYGLLQRFVGGQNYTSGQQALDAAILGQQSGALRDIRREASGLQQGVKTAERAAQNISQEYQSRAQQFRDESLGKLGELRQPIEAQRQQRFEQTKASEEAKTAAITQAQQVLDKATGGDYTEKAVQAAKIMSDAGLITPEQAATIPMMMQRANIHLRRGDPNKENPAKLFRQLVQATDPMNLSAEGLTTAEENARLAALSELAGQQYLTPQAYEASGTPFNLKDLDRVISEQQARHWSLGREGAPEEYELGTGGAAPAFVREIAKRYYGDKWGEFI